MIAEKPTLEDEMPATAQAVAVTFAGGTTVQTPASVVTRIRPAQGWQWINFGELWQFRELVYFLTWRDVKVRYKQTLLGAAWAILQPLMMMVVFTIFFGRMAGVSSGDLPYPLFAYAGLLPWTFFATAIAAAGNSVVGSERMITKIYFPRLAVPFAAVGAAVVDFLIAFGLLIGMMVYYRIAPGWGLLLVPAIFGAILLAALGVGTLLAALNVAYRDFRYVIPFMVQIWMFATPTVYMQPKTAPAGSVQLLLALNPMTSLITAFRASALGGTIPWNALGLAAAAVALAFFLCCLYFRKVEDGFADII
ncbi:MAG TPA: ABC transporter permease [Isosphaeraceae bacterium]|nr:ABC transporter permease [Isosphaeraceae bacterium]